MTTALKTVQQNPSPGNTVSREPESSKLSSPAKRSPKKMRRRTAMETRSSSLSKNSCRTSTVGLWEGFAGNSGWKMRLSWGTSTRGSSNGPFLSRTWGLSSTITNTALESQCGRWNRLSRAFTFGSCARDTPTTSWPRTRSSTKKITLRQRTIWYTYQSWSRTASPRPDNLNLTQSTTSDVIMLLKSIHIILHLNTYYISLWRFGKKLKHLMGNFDKAAQT